MALITVAELENYSNNFKADAGMTAIKTSIVNAASTVVTDYLGYDPISATRVYRTVGVGMGEILLPIPAVTAIGSIYVDGVLLDAANYSLIANGLKYLIERIDGLVFLRGAKVVINYTAGWTIVPDQMKLAALRIGGLMLAETEGNIGVTSKSFADLSKVFISYTNYDKYLRPLAPYRAEVV